MHTHFFKLQTALVVDDNDICRIIATTMLERIGFKAESASTGAEALASGASKQFQLILMDCDMPELDGLESTLALRQMEQGEHTIIIGVTSAANRQECLAVGMDDHIQKPLTAIALEAALRRWGCLPVTSRQALASVRTELACVSSEIEAEGQRLAAFKEQIEQRKLALASVLWHGTPSELTSERRQINDLSDAVRQREWALQTRRRFLARRQAYAEQIQIDALSA